jgi:hypothetical protein
MASRLLSLRDREPKWDAALDPSSAQLHLWLAQAQRDMGYFGARELAGMERKVGSMARRSKTIFNPFTGEIRKVDFG